MKRDLHNELLKWKASSRRKPLILQGARQVGKTYLLKAFGKSEYADMAYFNFDEDPGLDSLFQGRLDPLSIVEKLSRYRNKKIAAESTLIVFDEIQESANALNSLKYFCEEGPEYQIASAGSLLGITLSETKPFPVGKVNFLNLYPLTFFEFLDAVGKSSLRELLEGKNSFEPLESVFHRELIDILKEYFFVGGLPEAVSHYTETRDLEGVRGIQKEILRSYTLDFSKHAPPSDVMKINKIWESVPLHLAKENKKFTYSTFGRNARAREYENALQWLVNAGLVYKSYAISKPGVPLDGYAEKNIFKLFLLDVGLLSAMVDLTQKTLVEGNELFTHFKGAFVENYVAEELMAGLQKPLYYWASTGTAEVDFIVSKEDKVLPLEVKSGEKRKSRSLIEYGKKYSPSVLSRTSPANFGSRKNSRNYPLYGIALFPYHRHLGML